MILCSSSIEWRLVATKVGNLLYCSSRSMVPILRNCFVYFEMTVLRHSSGVLQTSMATLSFGLSTKEMPSTTLVGAWKGSVGLCTTGQILISGQWCSPDPDRSIRSFGDKETVGCLVCLDDSSAFETWDGTMVTATVTFNINGSIVSPHLLGATISGSDDRSYAQTQTNVPIGTVPQCSTLPLLVPAEEELYPTVTLHSPGTSVICRYVNLYFYLLKLFPITDTLINCCRTELDLVQAMFRRVPEMILEYQRMFLSML